MVTTGFTGLKARRLCAVLSAAGAVSLATLVGCATSKSVERGERRAVPASEALPAPGLAARANVLSASLDFRSQGQDLNRACRDARELIGRKSLAQAEDLILAVVRSLDASRVPRLPTVESETLYVYGEPASDWVPSLSDWSIPTILASRPCSEAARLRAGLKPRVRDLYAASPWKRVCYVYPAVPDLYRCLGYLAYDRGDYEEALGWLDTSIAWWPDSALAHAGKVEAMIRLRRYAEARQAALAALEHCVIDAAETASLERRLGFIAIEELALDEARTRFLASLSLEPRNQLARRELAFIDEVRPYGCIDRQERYFHAASGIRLPRKAGILERLRIAYADAADVEVDYEGVLALNKVHRPVSAILRLVAATWPRETACAAVLDSLRSGTPDLCVALDWHRQASPAPGVEVWRLAAASPKTPELVQVWLVQRGGWTVIFEARYSPASGLLGQDVLALQESLEGLVRSIKFPDA